MASKLWIAIIFSPILKPKNNTYKAHEMAKGAKENKIKNSINVVFPSLRSGLY